MAIIIRLYYNVELHQVLIAFRIGILENFEGAGLS